MSSLSFRPVKFSSGAVWWIKDPSARRWQQTQRKQSLSASAFDGLADLFRNISIHGYNNLFVRGFSIWEKLIWLAVHTTTLFVLLTVLTLTWEQFVAQYFAISLHDPLYPVQNVPFPAVAICSNNRISRQAAFRYANELRSKDPRGRPLEYFLERIKAMSNFYFRLGQEDITSTYDNFQSFLDAYDTWDNETFYNTKRIMRMLTPKCEDLLLECSLAGSTIDCMGPTAFQETMTTYGPCCSFNVHNSYRRRTRKNSFVDQNLGLVVVLNTSRRDDFSPILNLFGTMVIVHAPGEFADISSGGSDVVFPTYGKESFLSLKTRVIDTDDDLRPFSPKTRQCFFDSELDRLDVFMEGVYSFTNCITSCRIKSILALCKCLPFYMPLDLVERLDGVIYCTLQHVPCLMRYNFKWRNVLTERELIPGLEREMEEALYCVECLPACDDVQYQVSLMALPVDRFHSNIQSKNITGDLTPDEISVLHVHFAEPHTQYFRRVAVNAWFEAFSTVGNILSIFIGFSLVAICEILFYACKSLIGVARTLARRARRSKARHKDLAAGADEPAQLYICP